MPSVGAFPLYRGTIPSYITPEFCELARQAHGWEKCFPIWEGSCFLVAHAGEIYLNGQRQLYSWQDPYWVCVGQQYGARQAS